MSSQVHWRHLCRRVLVRGKVATNGNQDDGALMIIRFCSPKRLQSRMWRARYIHALGNTYNFVVLSCGTTSYPPRSLPASPPKFFHFVPWQWAIYCWLPLSGSLQLVSNGFGSEMCPVVHRTSSRTNSPILVQVGWDTDTPSGGTASRQTQVEAHWSDRICEKEWARGIWKGRIRNSRSDLCCKLDCSARLGWYEGILESH